MPFELLDSLQSNGYWMTSSSLQWPVVESKPRTMVAVVAMVVVPRF